MKSWHIAAYNFGADYACTDCISEWAEEELKKEGFSERDIENIVRNKGTTLDVGVFAYRAEILLYKLARIRGINIEDEYSFDSDDFPKVVFSSDLENEEVCEICLNKE